jgi:OmpA-OmpF porin, OOP family
MKALLFFLLVYIQCINGFAQSYKMEGNELVFEEIVHFKNGTAELTIENQKTLHDIKDFLNEKKYVSLMRIEGHVEANNPNSQALSEKRALSVSKWLISQGIDCKRLISVGFGNTKPRSSANSRISFVITALKDKLIGGMPADGGGQIAGDPCKISK